MRAFRVLAALAGDRRCLRSMPVTLQTARLTAQTSNLPLRFTRAGREMFALHVPAQAGTGRRRGVVLCNPFGQEAIRAHRFYRTLGQRLAGSGLDVLRFDYYGSGDSGGDDDEFDLDGAVLDTIAAAGLLRCQAGVHHIGFAGLRLGASIAWLASRLMPPGSSRLAMIEPVTDGAAYLRLLQVTHVRTLEQIFGSRWSVDARLRALHEAPLADESLGFALSSALRQQLVERLVGNEAWHGGSTTGLLLARQPEQYAEWSARWGGTLQVEASESDIDWSTNSALNTALVPMAWVERVRRFMLEEPLHA